MYFHLRERAEALFKSHFPLQPVVNPLPQTGLNWWVDVRKVTDETGHEVPVCLMVEDISRYALIFTYVSENFLAHLPQVLSNRLATHMALLLEQNSPEAMDSRVELYQTLANQLVDDLSFYHDGFNQDILITMDELASELKALDKLPQTLGEMIEAEVHANQQVRNLGVEDSVMPHVQFAQLLNLFITSRMLSTEQAEAFLNKLADQIGLAPEARRQPSD